MIFTINFNNFKHCKSQYSNNPEEFKVYVEEGQECLPEGGHNNK